jgi:hypothetical protein
LAASSRQAPTPHSGRAEGAGLDGECADRAIIHVAAMRVVFGHRPRDQVQIKTSEVHQRLSKRHRAPRSAMLPRCASSSDTVEIKYKSKHLRFIRGSQRDAAPLARPCCRDARRLRHCPRDQVQIKTSEVHQRLSKRRRAPRSARSVRFIDASSGLRSRWLACQRYACSALTRAVAARLPMRRQVC